MIWFVDALVVVQAAVVAGRFDTFARLAELILCGACVAAAAAIVRVCI